MPNMLLHCSKCGGIRTTIPVSRFIRKCASCGTNIPVNQEQEPTEE